MCVAAHRLRNTNVDSKIFRWTFCFCIQKYVFSRVRVEEVKLIRMSMTRMVIKEWVIYSVKRPTAASILKVVFWSLKMFYLESKVDRFSFFFIHWLHFNAGQMMFMTEWNVIMFLSSPNLKDLDTLDFSGLYINDLSMHDFSRDLLLASAKLRWNFAFA